MKMLIDGKWVISHSGETMTVRAPYDGAILDTVPRADAADVDAALTAAVRAQKHWAATPLYARADILNKFVDLVKAHFDDLSQTLCLDNGKPITQAEAEIRNLFTSVPAFIGKAEHLYETVIPAGSERGQDHVLQYVRRVPVGVVVCIVPFNFPSNLFSQKAIPALLAGNAALVLPPSGNPLTVLKLCALLQEAGVPDGVIQVVTAPGAVKEAAVKDVRTDLVSFTGSTGVGLRVASLAAANLTPCTLELGGNDPFIVFDDADMAIVMGEVFGGRLNNSGQICCASKRFLIHRSRVDEFTERTLNLVKNLTIGAPEDRATQIACLIDEKAAKTVDAQVRQTIDEGATLLTGGTRRGTFYAPTVLTDVTADMAVAGDLEIFGPVLPIIAFDTEEEAVRIANQSCYGLSSCLFTENFRRIDRVSEALAAGAVIVNASSRLRPFEMPFGGVKQSGMGTEGVSVTFEHMTRSKVVALSGVRK